MSDEFFEDELMELPDDSIPNYKIAWHIVDQAVNSHYDQWQLFRAIQDHIEGKKPIDPRKLKQQGLDWSSNFNFGKARASIEKAVAEFVKKISDALMVGFPEFELFDREKHDDEFTRFLEDPNRRGEVATSVGFSFYRALEESGVLYSWINHIEYLAYTFGFAPVIWDSHDWASESVNVTKIAFRPGSKADDLDTWVVFRTEKASDLYNTLVRITNSGKSKYWKKEGLQEVLAKLLSSRLKMDGGKIECWDDVSPMYDADPAGIINDTEDLNIACIYQKEFNGDISEVYIPWGYDWCNPNNANEVLGGRSDHFPFILYKKRHNGVDVDKFIKVVKDSGFTESGDIHSMRGFGKIATENSIRYNRMRNSMTDKAQLVGSPMFEQPSTQTKEKFKITPSQGFTLLAPGYVPIENQPSFDINSHLLIIGHEENEFSQITSHFKQDATGKLSSRPTEEEVRLAQTESNNIKSAKDRVKFKDYSDLLFHSLKRMGEKRIRHDQKGYKAQQKMFKLMKEHISFVNTEQEARRLISLIDGYSIDMVNTDMSSLQLAMQLSETPFARNRVKRMMMVANGFQIREINLAVPATSDKFRAFDDRRVALIENDMFWNTDQVAFSDTDDHIMHFQLHNEKIKEVFNLLRNNQLDVIASYDYLLKIFAHTMQHIDSLLEDPVLKSTAEDFLDEMREHRQVINQVSFARNKAIQEQEQAAQLENPGISPKDKHDMRLKQAQAEAQEQRNIFKTQQRGELKEMDMANKHEKDLRAQDLEHERELREIELEEERKRLKQNEQQARR